MDELKDSSEDALWNAIRVTQESAMLMEHIAGHAMALDDRKLADMLKLRAQHAHERAELLRSIATRDDTATAASLHNDKPAAEPEPVAPGG
jgi:hypothetical protein